MTGNGWVVVCAQVCLVSVAGAQGSHRVGADTTRYTESVRTRVVAHSGSSTRERRVVREARYTIVDSGRITIVRADSIALTEVSGGATRQVDVDAVIGGRWVLDVYDGAPRVVDRPFVPDDIADVSDIGRSLDDFWPPNPPTVPVGEVRTVGAVGWERLADSAGLTRYQWNTRVSLDTVRVVTDSVSMAIEELREETGRGAWSVLASRPVAWRREVRATIETEVRRRVVRSEVEQVIVVRRDS